MSRVSIAVLWGSSRRQDVAVEGAFAGALGDVPVHSGGDQLLGGGAPAAELPFADVARRDGNGLRVGDEGIASRRGDFRGLVLARDQVLDEQLAPTRRAVGAVAVADLLLVVVRPGQQEACACDRDAIGVGPDDADGARRGDVGKGQNLVGGRSDCR